MPNLQDLELAVDDFKIDSNSCKDENVIDQFLRLVKLKRLTFHGGRDEKIKYKHFKTLVSQLPLEDLEFNYSILLESDDEDDDDDAVGNNVSSSLSLSVCYFENFVKVCGLLKIIENLRFLTIDFRYEHLTNQLWMELLQTFKQLTYLKISKAVFNEISKFVLPSNLTTFYIEYSKGLTHQNLKEVLENTPQLIEFISMGTYYQSKQERESTIQISPLIEYLHVENLDNCPFQALSEHTGHSALKNVTLYVTNQFNLTSRLRFRGPNLPTYDMALNNLLQFQKLQTLTIKLRLPSQWSNLFAVLQKLPLLQQLTIRLQEQGGEIPTLPAAITTDVRELNIYYITRAEWSPDFWYDMFSNNPQMKLQMSIYLHEKDMLQRLLEMKNFPQYLRTIEIAGFTVDCAELRNNFEETLKTFKYDFIDMEFGDFEKLIYNIVLSRRK
ncbi:uncharacterized protein [Musca autumnalis]|uniref:uncharacterized protein n=1 Tax=Musca autumnalis TaxID=221902 RepID=UPI003CE8CDD6